MQILRELPALRHAVDTLRAGGRTVALVPTMGALHDGHMALVREAQALADHVIVSIFVNPTQFGPNEDLSTYPRQEAADSALLLAAGVDALWLPSVEVMYPTGFATNISVAGLPDMLCGASRPGHFDGVCTVVAKLFNQVRPDVAVFGEKDYQQLAIIRRMAIDLNFALSIVGAATERAADGLALSSRNAYLSSEQRTAAVALPRALNAAAAVIADGGDIAGAIATAMDSIMAAGFASIDYVELRDAVTLAPVNRLEAPARLLAAARIGTTRLIDNVSVHCR